jgi:hypothetical protein
MTSISDQHTSVPMFEVRRVSDEMGRGVFLNYDTTAGTILCLRVTAPC